jgi:hypothetical protein
MLFREKVIMSFLYAEGRLDSPKFALPRHPSWEVTTLPFHDHNICKATLATLTLAQTHQKYSPHPHVSNSKTRFLCSPTLPG